MHKDKIIIGGKEITESDQPFTDSLSFGPEWESDLKKIQLSHKDVSNVLGWFWMPIETAPRDGTKFDIFVMGKDNKGERWTDAWFDSKTERFTVWDAQCSGDVWTPESFGIIATHWIPIISSPNTKITNSGAGKYEYAKRLPPTAISRRS